MSLWKNAAAVMAGVALASTAGAQAIVASHTPSSLQSLSIAHAPVGARIGAPRKAQSKLVGPFLLLAIVGAVAATAAVVAVASDNNSSSS